jgi:hypothetical protein
MRDFPSCARFLRRRAIQPLFCPGHPAGIPTGAGYDFIPIRQILCPRWTSLSSPGGSRLCKGEVGVRGLGGFGPFVTAALRGVASPAAGPNRAGINVGGKRDLWRQENCIESHGWKGGKEELR